MTNPPDPKNVLRFEDPKHKRQVIRTEDLDGATLAALMGAQVPPESEALNYLMDAEPGERSKAAGRRIPPPPARDNDD